MAHWLGVGTQLSRRIHSTLSMAQQYVVDSCPKRPGTYIITYSLGSQVLVKCGSESLKAEARTQAYLYKKSLQFRSASGVKIRVPPVCDVFSDAGRTYVVMEYIAAPSFHVWISEPNLSAEEQARRADVAVDAIANTVEMLLQCPLPDPKGNGIGPVGGGCIHHRFFCDGEAPVSFVNTIALERYINRALETRGRPQPRISFEPEARLLCPSDLSLDTFLWDAVNERVWMTDFQYVNVLPHSFASFYFHNFSDKFVKAVAKKISLPVSPDLFLLGRAAFRIMQSGNSSFHLDENGDVKLPRIGSRVVADA